MGKARTKEECRRQIIKQAKNWLRKKRTIYVIGQRQNDVDYIYSLLENSSLKHCKFLRGGVKTSCKIWLRRRLCCCRDIFPAYYLLTAVERLLLKRI